MNNAYKNKGLVAMLILFATISACKKSFLEVVPKGRLVATKVSEYDQLLNYSTFINLQGANSQLVMGDEVAGVEPYLGGSLLRYARLFRWEPVIYQPNEDAPEFSQTMTNIYLLNKIINEVPSAIDGTEQQKASIIGQARAIRAHTYFLMINYYGKPYNSATAATDPGFPIVLDADVAETRFTRASVQEVYDFIIKDLVESIPDLPITVVHRERMSRAAAEAILGRLYVFMGRYNEARAMLDASLSHLGTTVNISLYNYTLATAFSPITVNGPTYPTIPNNTESLYGRQTNHFFDPFLSTINNNSFVLTPQALSLFTSTDRRLIFTSPSIQGGSNYPTVNGYTLRRRLGKNQFPVGPLLPDIYLLRAECRARANDLSGAVADLQFLRNTRITDATERLVPSNVATQQNALIRYIIDERIREFAFDGWRWFDMRRLSADPLFNGATYTHTVYSTTGTVLSTFTLTPERLTLKLPQKVLDRNPGMQDNP